MDNIFSIYYQHYGKEEVEMRKKKISAKLLKEFLSNYGFLNDDANVEAFHPMHWRMMLFQDMSEHIFQNRFEAFSKNSTSFYAKSLRLKFRTIVEQHISKTNLRNVYSIISFI